MKLIDLINMADYWKLDPTKVEVKLKYQSHDKYTDSDYEASVVATRIEIDENENGGLVLSAGKYKIPGVNDDTTK